MTLLLAFLGALGVWLTFTALTHKFVAHQGAAHESLTDAQSRVRLKRDVHLEQLAVTPILDRALRAWLEPASKLFSRVARRSEVDEQRLLQAGRPARYPTVLDFYAWKVLLATILFGIGIMNSLFAGIGFLPIAFGLGALGLFLPDIHLSQLIKKRRELVRVEMAFTLHRLVIHLEAGKTIAQVLGVVVAQPGGVFFQELREVVREFSTGTDLTPAMENLIARNPGIDDIARFAELVIRSQAIGQPLGESLRQMANLMQAKVESEVESRGLATSVKMVLPIGLLVLPAIGIVVMGPAVYLAAQYFLR
ncbi:MAG: type II secretion system F family protein [Anaerolineae bacterium]|nr:type II secretion system F family protein [Anaerolineae bacterium]